MKRSPLRLSATAAAIAAVTTLSACGGDTGSSAPAAQDLSAPEEKSGTLTMVTKFADPKYAPYFEKVVAAYEEANPEVDIQLEQVGDQPYKDKIRVLTASQDLPDIYFSWAGDFANRFIRSGLAADLTEVIGPDTEWGQTFAPAALETFEYEGRNYGVPINLDGKYLAYNTDLFEQAGVEVPTTMDELLTACDTLRDAGIQPIALGNQFGWPAIHFITQLNAYNVDPETLAQDYDPATGEFTDPGYVQALEQFAEINERCGSADANGLSHEAAQAAFLSGDAAMQYVESVEFGAFTEEGGAPAEIAQSWDFFRLPAPEGAPGDAEALTGRPTGSSSTRRARTPAWPWTSCSSSRTRRTPRR